ncbi:MAG: sugar phosphate nucleotidyltransferase [Candidatus Zixiibacteriota bacterium]
MRAIIPVAGVGQRLRPFTQTRPKPLLPVAGKPILGHIMDDILDSGIDDFVIVVGHLAKQIKKYINEQYGNKIKVEYIAQEKLLGLGYAVMLALEAFDDDDNALIILGDTIVKTNLKEILSSKKNVLGLQQVDDPRRFGVAEVDGNKVIGIIEKPDNPKSNWAVTGVYFINNITELKKNLDILWKKRSFTRGELQLTDALAMMIEEELDFTWKKIDSWFDCGTSKALLTTNRQLLEENINYPFAKNSVIIPPVNIDNTASVENSVIGPNVSIGQNAEIRHSILQDSIIGNKSLVYNALIGSSIIGNHAIFRGSAHSVNLGDWSAVRENEVD